MSCFKNPKFAKELAYRTMVNYYLLRDYCVKDKDTFSPELQRVLNMMKSEGFETSLKYEITFTLNSILGLLVLPQQECYKAAINSSGFERLPTLKDCIQDSSYINTYNEDEDNPAHIIRHMRNAVSHDKIMIIPESADNKNITHIQFRDEKHGIRNNKNNSKNAIKPKYEFNIRVAVDQLENLLMEIAEYLISFAP